MPIADTPGPSRYHSDAHQSGQPSGQRHSHARATLPTAARFADADPTIKVGPIGRPEHLAIFLAPHL